MVYMILYACLIGEPCTEEVVAMFPQPDAGPIACEMLRTVMQPQLNRKAHMGKATVKCEERE